MSVFFIPKQASENITRMMRDSVWTDGKPQSPPQHLSSMAAAMFGFRQWAVTSRGTCQSKIMQRESESQAVDLSKVQMCAV